ncbi:MAG: GNAT family N-acetyltransferase, partial [Candidatus Diapherotrites archaeon]|nr:GNAT family N-acetyltransferase [Candidatus Diapherotrites archaeon]
MPAERVHELGKRFHEFSPIKDMKQKKRETAVSSMKAYAEAFGNPKQMQEHAQRLKTVLKKNELHSILSEAVEKNIIHYNDLNHFTGLADKRTLEAVSKNLKKGITLRKATAKDLDAIMEIEKTFPEEIQAEKSTYRDIISRHPDGNLVAVKGNNVLAYLSTIRLKDRELSWDPLVEPSDHNTKGRHTFIWSLATLPSHEGMGIASSLMQELIRKEGKREIIATTPDMKKFYEKHGFEHEDDVEDYYGEGEDALFMTRKPVKKRFFARKEQPITETIKAVSEVLETHTAKDLSRLEKAGDEGEISRELQRIHEHVLPSAIKAAMLESESPEELRQNLMKRLQPKKSLETLLESHPNLLREGSDAAKIAEMAGQALSGEKAATNGLTHTETAILSSLTHDTIFSLHENPFKDKKMNKRISDHVKEIEETQRLIPNAEELLAPLKHCRLEVLNGIKEIAPKEDTADFYEYGVSNALQAIKNPEHIIEVLNGIK